MQTQDTSLFNSLDQNELSALRAISQEVTYSKDSILFYAGDTPTKLLLLLEGVVQIYKVDDKGVESVIHYFKAGELIAEMATLEELPYPANAVMISEGRVLEINLKSFLSDFIGNKNIALAVIRSLNTKIKMLERVLDKHQSSNSVQKVAKFLLEESSLLEELKQYQIAAILNIKPETFSRTIKKFKDDSIVQSVAGKLIVNDPERLFQEIS